MVISNRPLRFIIATLVACLPLMSFANPQLDSVVHTEVAHETTEKARKERTLNPDVKSEIKAFIGHHVLDSHDFTFLSDEVEESIMVFVTDNFVG
jgi:F-type H+-transporting ATPase subunit a